MTGILRVLRGIAMIGMGNAIRSVVYGRKRDRLEAAHPKPEPEGPARGPGLLTGAESSRSGARFLFPDSELQIRFLTPDFVFMGWDGAGMQPSWAAGEKEWPGAEAALEKAQGAWRLTSSALRIDVQEGGAVRIHDADGGFLREDGPPMRRGAGWSQSVTLPPEAGMYGLGFRFASFNLRRAQESGGPASFRFWNQDPSGYGPDDDPLYLSMPVYMCAGDEGCHLAFHDTTFDGSLTVGPEILLRFEDGPRRTYVAAGTPARTIELFTSLTGRPPLPPLWALGYQHSRWGFKTQAELRRVFEGFVSRGLPLSALYMDIDQLRGNRPMTVDPRTHPDLPAFAAEIASKGVHLVVITNPGIKRERGFPLYDEGRREDVFCREPGGKEAAGVVWAGWSAFPDFTSARVRQWWGRQYSRQLANGISGFWHDMNEPTSFVPDGDPTIPLCVRHDMEAGIMCTEGGRVTGTGGPTPAAGGRIGGPASGSGGGGRLSVPERARLGPSMAQGDHREAHNVYGMLMNRAGYEGLRSLRPDARPFIVSRSGWVGMQRWSWTWSGDVETTWDSLRRTVSGVLGLGLCGMPYTGPDIGGFTMAPEAELYVRWFQLSSFLPFFRTHCALHLPPREPWSFGPEVLEIVRASLVLRYALLPFWYTCAHESSLGGAPLVRPLFWGEPTRRDLRVIDDEFLLGGDILAAPVLVEGARSRVVVLPGGGWYPLARGGFQEGRIECAAPLPVMPVFARAGSIIPMSGGEGGLDLHAYMGKDGEARGALYNDDGDGYGPSRMDDFTLLPRAGGGYILSCASKGGYPRPSRAVALVLHGYPDGADVQGELSFTVRSAPSGYPRPA